MNCVSSFRSFAFDWRRLEDRRSLCCELRVREHPISSGNWAGIHTPQGIILAFQRVEEYVPPVWPWQEGEQQQMLHLDFEVDDLEKAVEHATKCGAKKAEVQYYDSSTVMFDPAGHPFCLSTVE